TSKFEDLSMSTLIDINFHPIFCTQLFLWVIAALAGLFCNQIIRYFKFDRKYRILRFGNSWYYFFSGEVLDFPDIEGSSKEIDYVFVDALVKAGSKEILYIGILSDYDLATNGGLKSFTLKGAKRRYLDSNETGNHPLKDNPPSTEKEIEAYNEQLLEKYYTIPSNLLVIPFDQNVVNINFRYYGDDE